MMEMLKMIEEAKDDLEVAEEQVDDRFWGQCLEKNFVETMGEKMAFFCSILCPKLFKAFQANTIF
jgi:hypothetical protein